MQIKLSPSRPPDPMPSWGSYNSNRDIAVVEFFLLGSSTAAGVWLRLQWGVDIFLCFLAFVTFLTVATLIVLTLYRWRFPFRAGVYRLDSMEFARWRFHCYLCVTNLFFLYQSPLLPPPLRKFFARLLGGRLAGGLISIGGVLGDPYFTFVDKDAMIGHDVQTMPWQVTRNRFVIAPIIVEKEAVVGARSVILPGVRVGAGAMIKVMSLVHENQTIPAGEVWAGNPARAVGRSIAGGPTNKFVGWRDLIITPLVTGTLWVVAGGVTYRSWGWLPAGWREPFTAVVLFYFIFVLVTMFALAGLRTVFPFRPGRYTFKESPGRCYLWALHSFLCIFNLSVQYQNGLLPPILRKVFYRWLGARFSAGTLAMPAIVLDPFMVTTGRGSFFHYDCLILPHAVTVDGLNLKPIHIGERTNIGARAVIMPGVTVGDGAEIESLSVVAMDTSVPPGERWGGVPARKVGMAVPSPSSRFLRWPDMVLTTSVELILLLSAAWCGGAARAAGQGVFVSVIVSYVAFLVFTLAFLKILRTLWPFEEGVYTQDNQPWSFYRWRLHGFLMGNNLFLHHHNGFLPAPFRRMLYQCLGARFGRGYRNVTGLLTDPFFITIEDGAVVDFECLLMPHLLHGGSLTLGRIRIGREAVIGARAVIEPGVEVGPEAQIEPLSRLAAGTRVPPGEIWGGNPARRLDVSDEKG